MIAYTRGIEDVKLNFFKKKQPKLPKSKREQQQHQRGPMP